MRFVRSAGPDDLEALLELALLSGPGFTSLPADEKTLVDRLLLSAQSFAGEVEAPEAWYTLMLEDSETGRVEGVAAVRTAVGLKRPHFSFRVVTLAQYSSVIETRFDHRALVLVNECGGWTEVGSLFLRPEARWGGAGRLLAGARYMLIGAEPLRFSTTVMAELRGWVESDGRCPFWDGVASKFYRLPFVDADRMIMSTDGQFILDLAPRHPIYVELINEEACEAIGRVHPDGEPAMAMLRNEGFEPCGLIDVFDGGPTMTCPRDSIATIANSVVWPVEISDRAAEGTPFMISAGTISSFRTVRELAIVHEGRLLLAPEAAELLGVSEGQQVRVKQ